jgi:tetratricopeptide (TPR) repeat protein
MRGPLTHSGDRRARLVQRIRCTASIVRSEWATLAITAAVFAVYASGACPTIYVGDSGELVTAVAVLGIPHPTGYPLYVLLGKAWTMIFPFGSVAWRMSIFSAACGALACGLLYRLCRRRLGMHPVAAAFAALLLAVSPSFWAEATIQRVYALNALFVVLATTAAFRWWERRDATSLAAAFFCCGLGATNHAFMALYALALAIAVAWIDPRTLVSRRAIVAAGAFVVGLTPYVYLPLRAQAHPPLNWDDPGTLHGFLDVILRREFWPRAWMETPADLLPIAGNFLAGVGHELGWTGSALAAIGVVAAFRRSWPVLLLVLVVGGNLAALALHGSRHDIFVWHRYYIPTYVLLALLAGLGCDQLIRRLPRSLRALPLAIPLLLLLAGWRDHDRSRYRMAEAFGDAVLTSLPRGAHLAASDDNVLFALMYLHLVEGRRPDVDLILQGIGGPGPPPLRFDPDADGLYFTHHPNWRTPALDVVPVGLVFRVQRAGRARPPIVVPLDELPGERDPDVPKDDLTGSLIAQLHYMLGFTYADRDWRRARDELARASAAAPDDDVLFYNLGLLYERSGLLDEAIAAFARSSAINPRHIASRGRPRAADRLAEATAERARVATIEAALRDDPGVRASTDARARHLRLADLLAARGETIAARGHRIRAALATDPGSATAGDR